MGDWEKIILLVIQFYLSAQLIFMISCLTWNKQSYFSKQDIWYLAFKLCQYFFQLVFYPNAENYQKIFKYHAFFYFIMDMYGLYLLDTKIMIFWILLSQLLFGLVILVCLIVYYWLFATISYFLNVLIYQEIEKLQIQFEQYLNTQLFIALLSFNLFRFYDYTYWDVCYLSLRVTQYLFAYCMFQLKNKDFGVSFHYCLDMIMNIYGLLYLNSGNILFWVILNQIVLGCFHFCLILFSLLYYTILNYYQMFYGYLTFRLFELDSNINQNSRYQYNFFKFYLITQLFFALTCFIQLKQYGLNVFEITYVVLRIIQYSFHLFYLLQNQGFNVHFNYHFTFNSLMDQFGLFILQIESQIFWIIILEITLSLIIQNYLTIEIYILKLEIEKTYIYIVKSPFENMVLCYFLFEIGLAIYCFKVVQTIESYYMICRIILYVSGIILVFFPESNLSYFCYSYHYFLFGWGFYYFTFQTSSISIFLSQLLGDIFCIGFSLCMQFYCFQNYFFLWLQNQPNKSLLHSQQKIKLLWCFGQKLMIQIQDQNNCSICYEPLQNGLSTTQLKCHKSHIFHKDCLFKWQKYHSTCPICRQPIQSKIRIIQNHQIIYQ